MKATKVTYWITTIAFASIFTTAGVLYLTHSAKMVAKLQGVGYPLYMLELLGTAKLLGALALVVPRFPRLKEWAYAGFVFDFIGAIWSHIAAQGIGQALAPFVPLTLVLISYVSYRRLQRIPEVTVK